MPSQRVVVRPLALPPRRVPDGPIRLPLRPSSGHDRRYNARVMSKRLGFLLLGIAACVLWAQPVWAQPVTVSQEGFSVDVFPLTADGTATAYYGYANDRSALPFVEAGHSVLFFYRNQADGALGLGMVHGPPALDVTNSTGIARFIFANLPPSSALALRDDPQDSYEFSPPVARVRWKWYTGRTDGMVIDQLGDDFSIHLTPHFIQGITQWEVLSMTPQGLKTIPLPSLEQDVRLNLGSSAGRGVRAEFFTQPGGPYYTYAPVAFDASASRAPAGSTIVLYEWDFDGDGVFEAQVERPTVTNVFQQAGSARVTLRVSTSGGDTANVTQELAVLARHSVEVVREISTSAALPGSPFRVTLSFSLDQDVVGLGIEERWPEGWLIQDVVNDGAVLKSRRGQWVFPQVVRAGAQKRIVYDVVVPQADALGALPAVFQVSGSLTASLPPLRSAISGERAVEVASCLRPEVVFAHFDVDQNALDLRLPETITLDQLTYAQKLWFAGQGVPHACGAGVTLSDYQRVLSHRMLGLPVDAALPDGGVGHGAQITRTIETKLTDSALYLDADNGRRFHVVLDVELLRPVTSVGLEELLPFGWTVLAPEDAAPGTLRHPKEDQWLLVGPFAAGQRLQLGYDVIVPASLAPGDFLMRGSAYLPDSAFSERVEGDQVVRVLECLSVLQAVAHWNVETLRLDFSLDSVIRNDQVMAATDLWLADAPVPGTCGQRIDYQTLGLITEYALAGVPIHEPLPDAEKN